jgi:hypothetical protein
MPKLCPRLGLKCPRCNNIGLFNYPYCKEKRYGPDKFYCETCDPYHQAPILGRTLEKIGGLKKGAGLKR